MEKQEPPHNILLKAAKAPVDSNIISSPVNLTYYVNKKECYATVCQTVLFSFSHPQKKKKSLKYFCKITLNKNCATFVQSNRTNMAEMQNYLYRKLSVNRARLSDFP